jgi:hypothetical protein
LEATESYSATDSESTHFSLKDIQSTDSSSANILNQHIHVHQNILNQHINIQQEILN